MRVLFGFAGGSGHGEPLMPIARAAEHAGHTVAFACAPWMVDRVERRAFTAFAVGAIGAASSAMLPLREFDQDDEDRALREHFAGRLAAERADGLLALCASWRPDVVVCDEVDFGSMIAAERAGIPLATVVVIAAGGFLRPEVIADALNRLRAAHGLRADADLSMLSPSLVLAPVPPTFRDPSDPLPATARHLRPGGIEPPGAAPDWVTRLDREVPAVYITLGTIFNVESGDLFSRLIDAVRPLPVNALVTVGPQLDPTMFGELPPHVRVERFVPQAQLLPHCDLVLSHGGSGSVLGALGNGLPSVVVPLGADQPGNARRCEALGVGLTLDALRCTPADIREAIVAGLADARYARNAQAVAREISTLPGPDHAVHLLERLVR